MFFCLSFCFSSHSWPLSCSGLDLQNRFFTFATNKVENLEMHKIGLLSFDFWFLNCYFCCDYHCNLLQSSVVFNITVINESEVVSLELRIEMLSPKHLKVIRFCWVRIIETTNKIKIIIYTLQDLNQ